MIGPASTVNEALEAVANVDFDVAVLDINLRGELSFPVADELLARDVPFLFLTGYDNDVLPERFRDLPSLGKPHDPKGIADLVARLSAGT